MLMMRALRRVHQRKKKASIFYLHILLNWKAHTRYHDNQIHMSDIFHSVREREKKEFVTVYQNSQILIFFDFFSDLLFYFAHFYQLPLLHILSHRSSHESMLSYLRVGVVERKIFFFAMLPFPAENSQLKLLHTTDGFQQCEQKNRQSDSETE